MPPDSNPPAPPPCRDADSMSPACRRCSSACSIVVFGDHDPQSGRRQVAGMDRGSGGAGRRRGAAGYPRQDIHARPSRSPGSLYPGADLCARHRLRERLEGRHRHAGQSRRAPGRSSTRPISTSRSCRPKPTLASAKANSVLADATLKRGQYLITTYAISQQDLDQRSADCLQQARLGARRASQPRPLARARTI